MPTRPLRLPVADSPEPERVDAINANFEGIFDRPFPFFSHTGDAAALQADFPAAQHDRCFAYAKVTGTPTLHESDGAAWNVFSSGGGGGSSEFQEYQVDGIGDTAPTDKGIRLANEAVPSLFGIENSPPIHWRGNADALGLVVTEARAYLSGSSTGPLFKMEVRKGGSGSWQHGFHVRMTSSSQQLVAPAGNTSAPGLSFEGSLGSGITTSVVGAARQMSLVVGGKVPLRMEHEQGVKTSLTLDVEGTSTSVNWLDGIRVRNSVSAGTPHISPMFVWEGLARASTPAEDHLAEFGAWVTPANGTTEITAYWTMQARRNQGTAAELLRLLHTGELRLTATDAALLLNLVTGDPSSLADGMVWYDPTADEFKGRKNGATVTFTTS